MGPHAVAVLKGVGRHHGGRQVCQAGRDVLLAGRRSGLELRRRRPRVETWCNPKANPPPCAGTGSGKLLSPWERMHTAYLSNCASVGPDEPEELEREELEPEGALGLVVAVLVLPSLATALCAGVAPQAATRKLKDASTAAMTTGRVGQLCHPHSVGGPAAT